MDGGVDETLSFVERGRGWARAALALGHMLADMALPPLCLSCGQGVEAHGALCGSCWATVGFIEAPFCPVNGVPFPYDPGPGIVSAAALASPPPYAKARAVMRYSDESARLVHRFKYADRMEAAPAFARWMARAGAELLAGADFIAPVPLHRRRLFSRRFNQSAELARRISGLSGAVFLPDLLERVRATRPQVGLSGAARRRNVAGAFRLRERSRELVKGKVVVIVDDVMTTGATVEACARVLNAAGAAEVRVLCLARVVPGEGATI